MAEVIKCAECGNYVNLETEIIRLADGRIFCRHCMTEITEDD